MSQNNHDTQQPASATTATTTNTVRQPINIDTSANSNIFKGNEQGPLTTKGAK